MEARLRLVANVDFSSWIPESFIESPDSKRVAYVARQKGEMFVVVDGEEGKQYDSIVVVPGIFSPDDPDSIHYMAMIGSGVYTVEARIE